MARTTSTGTCALCGYQSSKAGMTRHLKTCPGKHDASGKGRAARLFHLRVESAESPLYWLDLEIKASATLMQLDDFLRAIWLECCGHLSAFEIAGLQYSPDVDMAGDDFFDPIGDYGLNVKLAEVLEPGMSFSHEYDFGSTTYLKLSVKGEREGRIGRDSLRLLARNDPPEWVCQICGKPAAHIHTEELWDSDNPFYCEAPAEEHGDDWALLPVVNSPRMGVCGYTG